jgi:hypothetical protein
MAVPLWPNSMTTYQIVGPNGEILATLACDGMRFDLEHPQEHIIPLDSKTIAATITLGYGCRMEEYESDAHQD